jgi:hypothetical protein
MVLVCTRSIGRPKRRNRLVSRVPLLCHYRSGGETPKQSAGQEKREDLPRSLPVHQSTAHRGPSDGTSRARPALFPSGPCGLGHWMSRGTNRLLGDPNCCSPPHCARAWAFAKEFLNLQRYWDRSARMPRSWGGGEYPRDDCRQAKSL